MRPLHRRWTCLVPLAAWLTVGCSERRGTAEPPRRLPVSVFADTALGERLHIVPPPEPARPESAAVWLAHVAPTRPALIAAPLPDPSPSAIEDVPPSPPALQVDPGLKPPLLKRPGALHIPPRGRGFVELDVRVGEDGTVTDAIWAGGSEDSSLTAAATQCALAMEFYPALRAGRPTAVWCRQRFDFSSRGPSPITP
jgi:TonB family protein